MQPAFHGFVQPYTLSENNDESVIALVLPLMSVCLILQGRTKPWKVGFENLLHKVPPPYIPTCFHFSWEKKSKQLT